MAKMIQADFYSFVSVRSCFMCGMEANVLDRPAWLIEGKCLLATLSAERNTYS